MVAELPLGDELTTIGVMILYSGIAFRFAFLAIARRNGNYRSPDYRFVRIDMRALQTRMAALAAEIVQLRIDLRAMQSHLDALEARVGQATDLTPKTPPEQSP